MIIDFHSHVEYKNPGERYSPDEFVKVMDRYGIDKSVVLGCDEAEFGLKPLEPTSPGPINWSNEEVAAFCSKYPDRLIGFASIHPDRDSPDKIVERAIKELGLKGVKLYPHAGFYPNDSRLNCVYRKCMELGTVMMIHTGIKALRQQWIKYNNPIWVDDVATNFPSLQIVMCHCGFPWANQFLAVAHSNPNVWVDLTFLDYIERVFKKPYLAEETIKQLVSLIGTKRLLWGSEGPFMNLPLFGKHGPDNYARSQEFLVKRFDWLSEQDKTGILGENAVRLLGL